MKSADDQQERLDGYIAGYVDGEGSFSVTVNRNPTSRFKLQLVPEFHVSQNGDRREVLDEIRRRLDCGYVKRNGRNDRVMVFVVRRRLDLLTKVIPFFERNPLISSKQHDFETFAKVVRAMAIWRASWRAGFQSDTGTGTVHERSWAVPTGEMAVANQPSRILRDCTPDGVRLRRYSPSYMATCRAGQK